MELPACDKLNRAPCMAVGLKHCAPDDNTLCTLNKLSTVVHSQPRALLSKFLKINVLKLHFTKKIIQIILICKSISNLKK